MGRYAGMGGHVESRVRLSRIAQMTEADYAVHRCRFCGGHINTVERPNSNYCSKSHQNSASQRHSGAITGLGKRMRWAAVYDEARKANGAWVDVTCETPRHASNLQITFSNKRGFESSRNDLVVSIRFMGVV